MPPLPSPPPSPPSFPLSDAGKNDGAKTEAGAAALAASTESLIIYYNAIGGGVWEPFDSVKRTIPCFSPAAAAPNPFAGNVYVPEKAASQSFEFDGVEIIGDPGAVGEAEFGDEDFDFAVPGIAGGGGAAAPLPSGSSTGKAHSCALHRVFRHAVGSLIGQACHLRSIMEAMEIVPPYAFLYGGARVRYLFLGRAFPLGAPDGAWCKHACVLFGRALESAYLSSMVLLGREAEARAVLAQSGAKAAGWRKVTVSRAAAIFTYAYMTPEIKAALFALADGGELVF